jgi:hypothetical protein
MLNWIFKKLYYQIACFEIFIYFQITHFKITNSERPWIPQILKLVFSLSIFSCSLMMYIRVMLQVPLISLFSSSNNDVAIKITIGLEL